MKNNLLIDIGNTRIKWALDSVDGFGPGGESESSRFKPDIFFAQHWKDLSPQHILISCVGNQDLLQQLKSLITAKWGLEPEILVSPAKANGITSAYTQPAKLGSDRWAAMVGAFDEVGGAVCVVDCGTAVTVDVVTADGQHQGGLITSGLGLTRQSLQTGTNMSFSEYIADACQDYLGQSTEECIERGAVSSVCGMVNQVYQTAETKHGNVKLILTGGDVPAIKPCLAHECIVIPELVLRGMAVIQRSRTETMIS